MDRNASGIVRRAVLVSIGALLLGSAPVVAQVRAGGEFRANTQTLGHQISPFVAFAGDGAFLVAWHRSGGGDVSARRFNLLGAPQGNEFQVGVSGEAYGFPNASVAGTARGQFVVTWTGDDGSYAGVFGRRYDAAGASLGPAFQINTYTTLSQWTSSVGAAADGSFVVSWSDSGFPNGAVRGAFAQRYSPGGAPRGVNFRVDDIGGDPVIAVAAAGHFVVAWSDFGGVFARRFDAAGTPLGPAFLVSAATAANAQSSAIASDVDGNFIVAWYQGAAGDFDVYARRFAADGTPRGSDFRVNVYTTLSQAHPSVAMDAVGSFTVAWRGDGLDPSGIGVSACRFRADGTPRGGEFVVPTSTSGTQAMPAVASDNDGNFVVVWSGESDGSGYGVFGQRFGGIRATAMEIAAGNGVVEAGESVVVAPAWTNVNGATQTFAGVAVSFTGPVPIGNPDYTLVDGAAAYGTVPDGAIGSCLATGDCYTIQISVPDARPADHWDAVLREEITPDGFGQEHRWRLHVGDSFADVPRSNPFYRFVETLLHHGVTGGCAAGAYCPSASTTREQMAPFVLVAKEGVGYVPPACGTPVFGDVPASSPFCRWIEELARRGVVSGCGPGLYCPTAPVTREQMAVFVLRTLDPALDPSACTAGAEMFADVPASSPFCRWIEELARRGVVTGCGGGNYCPTAPVTREQMAVFLGVTFGLTLYGP